jgi:hypothetical protein
VLIAHHHDKTKEKEQKTPKGAQRQNKIKRRTK